MSSSWRRSCFAPAVVIGVVLASCITITIVLGFGMGAAPAAAQAQPVAPNATNTTNASPGTGPGPGNSGVGGVGGIPGTGGGTGQNTTNTTSAPGPGSGPGPAPPATGPGTGTATSGVTGVGTGSGTVDAGLNSSNRTTDSGGSGGGGGGGGVFGGGGMFSVNIDPVQIVALLAKPFFEFARGLASGIIELITARQYPQRNGSLALTGQPTNAQMPQLREWWMTYGLPGGIVIWLISYMGLWVCDIVWPPGKIATEIRAARKDTPGKLGGVIFSWMLGALILFIASMVIEFAAPEGAQIAPDMAAMTGQAAGAGWGLILAWLFGGTFLIGIAATFFVTWLFLYIMLPALPILIALSVPSFWIFTDFANSMRGLCEKYVSAAFYPLPTALVLGIGYPFLNAMQGSLPGPAQWGTVGAYGIGVVVVWFLALIAPVYVFWYRDASTVAALAGAGIGALSASHASDRLDSAIGGGGGSGGSAGTTPPSGAGRSVDPTEGSPLSRSSSTGSANGPLGAGSSGSGSALGAGTTASGGSGSSPSPAQPTSPVAGSGAGTGSSGASPSNALPDGVGASINEYRVASGSGSTSGSGFGSASQASATTTTTSTSTGASTRLTGSAGGGSDGGAGVFEGIPPEQRPDLDEPMLGEFPVAEGSKENATPVGSAEELPEQHYRIGYFKEESGRYEGESFEDVANRRRQSSFFGNTDFERFKNAYEKPIHLIGQDAQSYDVTALPASDNSNAGLSAAEQHAESRSTVDDINDDR